MRLLVVLLLAGCASDPAQVVTQVQTQTVRVPVAVPCQVHIPNRPATFAFTVRRQTAGQSVTVPIVVVDLCGSWQTFVGGGPAARF